jgi:hypothetical protein
MNEEHQTINSNEDKNHIEESEDEFISESI